MGILFQSLWQGALAGAFTRARAEAVVPQRVAAAGSIGLALFWFGFETTNAVVFGRR